MESKKGKGTLGTLGKLFIAIVLGVMVMMVFVNAVARYGFSENFPVFEELSRYLFVWVAFLGAMLAYVDGKHVGIDMLVSHLHGKARLIVKMISQIAVFVCLAVMGWGAWGYFSLTATDPSPSAGIPFGMISGMAIVLTVFMFIITVRDTLRIFKAYKAGEYEKEGGHAE